MASSLFETLQGSFIMLVSAISLLVISTYLVSMGLGIATFFATPEGVEFSDGSIVINPLLVIDARFSVNRGVYFLFLWSVFAICFAAAWKYRSGLAGKVRGFFRDPAKKRLFDNNLLAMPTITSALLIGAIILDGLQSRVGIPTGSLPPGDPFFDFLRFSQAPLLEEVVFRILPIGVFMVTYTFVVGRAVKPDWSWIRRVKTCVLAVLQPDRAKKIVGLSSIEDLGLRGGVIWAEWAIVLFTASVFGFAHYLGGWGLGKISQAAMSGAVFALAYLYYGIQAPILLHWYFNYYLNIFQLASGYYSAQVNAVSFIALSLNLFLGTLVWVAPAAFGAAKLAGRMSGALIRKD
ncbi:MAG: CPBP family glutamic-type intramembrane protease [Candidatus Bathyarchaeota archaeon]|nr:CPBP family glutamic-type intramembrane protease [Candidatus Bathyarchaeota archaeon]